MLFFSGRMSLLGYCNFHNYFLVVRHLGYFAIFFAYKIAVCNKNAHYHHLLDTLIVK